MSRTWKRFQIVLFLCVMRCIRMDHGFFLSSCEGRFVDKCVSHWTHHISLCGAIHSNRCIHSKRLRFDAERKIQGKRKLKCPEKLCWNVPAKDGEKKKNCQKNWTHWWTETITKRTKKRSDETNQYLLYHCLCTATNVAQYQCLHRYIDVSIDVFAAHTAMICNVSKLQKWIANITLTKKKTINRRIIRASIFTI